MSISNDIIRARRGGIKIKNEVSKEGIIYNNPFDSDSIKALDFFRAIIYNIQRQIKMKNLLLVLVCLSLTGCSTVSETRRLQKEISDLKECVLEKDEVIKLKDSKLEEKDLEISKLRKQLESLGVFH
ncbi:DUF641 domain-containing protein [bacterium]|nr:MAG: DUF641 domain-containing protein [bacterium]